MLPGCARFKHGEEGDHHRRRDRGIKQCEYVVRRGYEVTLVEAKDYLGGRIHSVETTAGPIELGAEFLHGESKALREVIEAAELTTEEVSEDYRLLENQHLKPANLWDKMSRLIQRVDATHRDLSFKDFLDTQHLDDEERAQAIGFVEGFHAAHPERIGAHALLRGQYAAEHMLSTSQARIKEGYPALVNYLAREIRSRNGNILLNAVVHEVAWQRACVRVTFGGNRVEAVSAEAAIVTLPLGVLKAETVKFQPPLTHKLEAINQLQFGQVLRSMHIFKKQWWPDFGFILALNEAIPTWWTDPHRPILTGWAGGPKAEALLYHSREEIEELGLQVLERIFSEQKIAVRQQHLATHAYDWAADPFTRGAYSYTPVNGLGLLKVLGAPLADTLFFAGEATVTDGQTGTVFGAFETGLRAAAEIIEL